MAENGNGAAPQAGAQPAGQAQMKVQVLAQFIRDLSFENGFAQNAQVAPTGQPDIQVQVSLDARKREVEHQYEVITKFRIESKVKDGGQTLFIIEMEYAGLFHIEGVPQEQLHPFLLIECPRILFPFARRIISDISRDGGFPALNLDMIDFMALYRQELARQQQAGQGDKAVPTA
ncbi:MAG: protein-export chaperone SecB [Pararhodobacter sp.]|nr:protein-export chaperone SecB [Pararhodobacter sp.]